MTINRVQFTSRRQAELLPGNPSTAVISITDPGTPEANLCTDFKDVLRLSFYDAVPADEYQPAPKGLFDHLIARQVGSFVHKLRDDPADISVMVHCEYGVSRSAAVALFVEAYAKAPLAAREFAYDANQWVVDRLLSQYHDLQIDIPPPDAAHDRRTQPRID